MTSRERVKKILNFEIPDRIGIWDAFCDGASWSSTVADNNRGPGPADIFGYDIRLVEGECPKDEKFAALAISDPFEEACKAFGWDEALKYMASQPAFMQDFFEKKTDEILKKEFNSDGVWLWADVAYRDGLLFSYKMYEKLLLPYHRRIVKFFNSREVPVIFHSDGDVREIIPALVDIGVGALHPLQDMDIAWLKKEYGRHIVLFGNMDFGDDLQTKLAIAKEGGGYIYSLKGPIGSDVNLKDYKAHLAIVKELGRYQ